MRVQTHNQHYMPAMLLQHALENYDLPFLQDFLPKDSKGN